MFFRPSGCGVLSCFLCLVGCSCGVGVFVQSVFLFIVYSSVWTITSLLFLFYRLNDVSVFLFFFGDGAGTVVDKKSVSWDSLISETLGLPVT